MSVRRKGPRATAVRVATYLLLVGVAFVVLFPFVVAVSTSLKESTDIFRYPPSLIPRTDETVDASEIGGEPGTEVPVYTLPGRTGQWALADNGISLGIYAPLGADGTPDTAVELVRGLDEVEPTGDVIVFDGDEVDVVAVPTDDGTVLGVRVRTTIGASFVSLDDPTLTASGLVNDAVAAQRPSIRTENFTDVVEGRSLGRSLTNTLLVTIGVVVGQVVTSIMGGYAFARLRFRGRDTIFLLYLASVMIPFVVLVIPLFQLMIQLDWRDNLVSLIIPFVFWAYGTFLMRQFFVGIPTEIEEAALLDGASRSRILWRIMVPLARPAIASLATFGFLYAWNSFFWPFVIINSGNPDSFVLSLSLAQLGGRSSTDTNLVFAGAVVAMTPPILVFLFAQRYFVENAASSGLK